MEFMINQKITEDISASVLSDSALSLSISTITEPFKNPRILSSDMDPDPLESAFN